MNLKNLIKNSFYYTITKYFIMVVGFFKSLLIAKYLGPTLLGSYSYISLIIEYLSYYNLGVYSSMNREVSINYGDASKKIYIQKVFNTSLSFSLALLAPIVIVSIITYMLKPNIFPEDIREYVLIIIAILFFVQFRYYFLRYFRLYERYYIIILFEVVSTLTILLGVLLFVPKYSLQGLMYSLLVSNLVTFVISIMCIKHKLKFTLNKALVKKLVFAGIPLLFFALGEKLFVTVDRIMIIKYFTLADLGQYQLGKTMAYGVLMSLDAVLFIFYPKVLKYLHVNDNKNKNNSNRSSDLIKITNYLDVLVMPLILIGIIFLPLLINFVLLNYSASIYITKILLLGYGFQNLTYTPSSYLVANDQQKKLSPIIIVALLFMFLGNYSAIKLGYGIDGIVIATSLIYLIYASLVFIACFQHLNEKIIKNTIRAIWKRSSFFIIALLVINYNYNIFLLIIPYLIIYGYTSLKTFGELRHKFFLNN